MTHTTAADKVKQIIESWESATNHAPVGEWSIDIFLKSKEGSRLVGELVENSFTIDDMKDCFNAARRTTIKSHYNGAERDPVGILDYSSFTEYIKSINHVGSIS